MKMILLSKGKAYRWVMPEWTKLVLYCAGCGGMMYLLFGIYASAVGHPIW